MQDIEGVVAESFNSPPTPEIDVLWVAYSGGLDSTCLLHMAVDHFGPELIGAIHINHGADADSDEWEQHCHRTAESLGVQFHSERIGPFDGNFEAKSRAARYSLWSQQLGDDDIIVTAHHANDVAETRLWQMLTGRAAIGIPVWRPLGRGWVWRPLLGVTRSQLQQWAEQRNLTWIRDQSNDDLRFDRNWIRHELLPSLDKRFPNVVTAIAGMQHTHFGRPRPAPLPINEIGRANTMEVLRSWLVGVPDRTERIRGPRNCPTGDKPSRREPRRTSQFGSNRSATSTESVCGSRPAANQGDYRCSGSEVDRLRR